jgi:hypothetical protein
MKIRLVCPSCGLKYYPDPDDFTPEPVKQYGEESEKIFLRRYGQDQSGKHIECLVCTGCNSITYAQIAFGKFIPALMGVSSPYKAISIPIHLDETRRAVNKIADTSSREIKSILEEDFSIPPHIFDFLLEINLFTIDKLGLKYRYEYCDIHRTIGAFTSNKYSVQEMREQYDINDRLEEINKHKSI